jgi:phage baseplate assembly protein V
MNDEIAAAFRDLFRVGIVVSTDPENCTARVRFSDADDFVSGDLQVLQRNTLENKNYFMPDVDEMVFCIFLGNGSVAGIILGSVYNSVDVAPQTSQDINYIKYKDETLLKYDRKEHKLTADIKGGVDVQISKNEGSDDSEEADGTLSLVAEDGIKVETPETLDVTAKESVEIKSPEINLGKKGYSEVVCQKSACPLFGVFHTGSNVVKVEYP